MDLGRRALRHHEGIHRLASQVVISVIRSDALGTHTPGQDIGLVDEQGNSLAVGWVPVHKEAQATRLPMFTLGERPNGGSAIKTAV